METAKRLIVTLDAGIPGWHAERLVSAVAMLRGVASARLAEEPEPASADWYVDATTQAATADVVLKPDDACSEGTHDKCYSGTVLTSFPPQYLWACRRCPATGVDETAATVRNAEYDRLTRPPR